MARELRVDATTTMTTAIVDERAFMMDPLSRELFTPNFNSLQQRLCFRP